MVVKIFWQENCVRCPPAKELGDELMNKGHQVELLNVKEGKGLAQAIYHDVLATPSIVVVDDANAEIASWRSEVPSIGDILEHL